jgi:hypothetical protein
MQYDGDSDSTMIVLYVVVGIYNSNHNNITSTIASKLVLIKLRANNHHTIINHNNHNNK